MLQRDSRQRDEPCVTVSLFAECGEAFVLDFDIAPHQRHDLTGGQGPRSFPVRDYTARACD